MYKNKFQIIMPLPTTYEVRFADSPTTPNDFGAGNANKTIDGIFEGLDHFIGGDGVKVGQLVYAQETDKDYILHAWMVTEIGYNPDSDKPVYYVSYTPEHNLRNFSGTPCEAAVFSSYSANHTAGEIGVAYVNDVTFSAGAPLTLGSLTLPDGITASVNGLVVELRGTPTTEGDNVVDFDVAGCNGEIVNIAYTLIVTAAVCTPVEFDSHSNGSHDQLEAGVEYNNTLSYTGTAPITLEVADLPDGLSAVVNGMSVEITGEPTGGGDPTYEAVIEVSNCSGASTDEQTWTMNIN